MHDGYGVFLGLDVGKEDHHAVGLNRDGKRLHDAPLPNTEAGLGKLFDKLTRHGRILAVVDQPASIGALPVAVARALRVPITSSALVTVMLVADACDRTWGGFQRPALDGDLRRALREDDLLCYCDWLTSA